jgi:hypothetical protein
MQIESNVLAAHLQNANLGLAIVKENRDFKPPQTGEWLNTAFYGAGESPIAINGSNESGGYFQIDVMSQKSTGVATILKITDQVRALFRPGTVITNSYGTVVLSKITIAPFPSDTHAGRVVRVLWRSFN